MRMITFYVFLPLMIILMIAAFSNRLRNHLVQIEYVRKWESKLVLKPHIYWLLFVLTIAAGVFTRCWRFLELPLGYNQDGLMTAIEAYCLAMGGVDQLGVSWPTYFEAWGFAHQSPLYAWIMMPFMKMLGSTRLAMRLPMLIVSLSTLPLIWDFARRLFGKGFALLVLFIAAINPWHILQSRWAMDCNIMPHMLLLACYLLLLGRSKRLPMYLSMVFFALSIYGYGLACFSVPVILLGMAVYYLAQKKAKVIDILVCVVIFFGIAGPFFYTMVINAFGLETVQLGPITLSFFENSQRTMDMPFSHLNPYAKMLSNVIGFVYATVLGGYDSGMNVIEWTHTMYRFMPPLILYALYRMWRDRGKMVLNHVDSAGCDGMMLLLVWILASLVNGLMIDGGVYRNNVIYYPMIIICAYGLYLMGKRLRTAAALALAMLVISFVGLNVFYFTNEEYHHGLTTGLFHDGLVDALEDTWDWDYDEIYISVGPTITSHKLTEASIMFAHDIDYAGRSEQTELLNAHGEPTGWYFTERYHLVDMTTFEPNPEACSLYIFRQSEKKLFDEADYLITDYANYAVAYPRYWAE